MKTAKAYWFPFLTLGLMASTAFAGKETIHIQIGKDKDPFDTVQIWIDFDVLPEVPPQMGKWTDYEKDSSWIDSGTQYVRYRHAFQARKGLLPGFGSDFIHYRSNYGGLPEYSASCGFSFQYGDTSESFTFDPMHMNERNDLDPALRRGLSTESYGELAQWVESENKDVAEGVWIRFLSREPGWVSDDIPVAVKNGKQADRSQGWLVHMDPGMMLRAPAGAKALRVFDVQGRLHWEIRNLRDGAPVALPEGLPQGTLRYRWL